MSFDIYIAKRILTKQGLRQPYNYLLHRRLFDCKKDSNKTRIATR
ncbi:MAG: hypothetical protein ACRCVG_08325 [Methanobacteriaceae archaeon]